MIFGYVVSHLHGGLGDSGNLASILLEVRQVAEHKDFGEAGRIEAVVDDDATSLVEGGAEQFAERGGLHACCPEGDCGFNAFIVGLDPTGADASHLTFGVDFDAKGLQGFLRLRGEIFWVSRKDARASIEENHPCRGGIDMAKVMAHVLLCDVTDGACQFNSSGTATDDHEVEWRMPAVDLHLPLGKLKGEQNTATDLYGVFEGLEAWG